MLWQINGGKMKYDHKLVEVFWLDAETSYGWEEIKETDLDPALCVTVGFLISFDKYHIVVASTYAHSSCNSRIKIPVGMIQTITELNTTRKKGPGPLESPVENPLHGESQQEIGREPRQASHKKRQKQPAIDQSNPLQST